MIGWNRIEKIYIGLNSLLLYVEFYMKRGYQKMSLALYFLRCLHYNHSPPQVHSIVSCLYLIMSLFLVPAVFIEQFLFV